MLASRTPPSCVPASCVPLEDPPDDPPLEELPDPASRVRPPELLELPLELPLQKKPKRHPPLLDPVRPPEEPLLDPVPPPDEELPEMPLDPPPPEHVPALQLWPLRPQSLHVTPPVPHALSAPLVSQEPLRSQQPVQLVESHVAPCVEASSPVPMPAPLEVPLVVPLFPELLEDCEAYEVPAPESSPLLPPGDPPELGALDPPDALGDPKPA